MIAMHDNFVASSLSWRRYSVRVCVENARCNVLTGWFADGASWVDPARIADRAVTFFSQSVLSCEFSESLVLFFCVAVPSSFSRVVRGAPSLSTASLPRRCLWFPYLEGQL